MSRTKLATARQTDDGKQFPVTIVLEYDADDPSEYKWTAHCPALPACFSEGRTREEAVANVREVVAAYFDRVPCNFVGALYRTALRGQWRHRRA
jgi:predicted RNase H-like HicB family nuclease